MDAQKLKARRAERRKFRVRRSISGTAALPRLSVHRTNQHIYAQLIDDDAQNYTRGGVEQRQGCAGGLWRQRPRF